MINPFKEIDWSPGLAEKRKFAVSLMIGFPSLALAFSIFGWLTAHCLKSGILWMGIAGFALGGVLWVIPAIAKPIYLLWYFLACCIGFIVGNLLFSLFFFLVFTPVALLRRHLAKPAFTKKIDRNAASYWRDPENVIEIEQYYRQF